MKNNVEKETEEKTRWYYIIFIIILLSVFSVGIVTLVTISYDLITDYFDDWETIEITLGEENLGWTIVATSSWTTISVENKNIVTEIELDRLFPYHKEDWKYAQEFAGVSGLGMPVIEWQDGTDWNDLGSNGSFAPQTYTIDLDRFEIFGTSTRDYARYVMIHEMTHSTLEYSDTRNRDLERHCDMLTKGFFVKTGNRIGNYEIGQNAYTNYKSQCTEE